MPSSFKQIDAHFLQMAALAGKQADTASSRGCILTDGNNILAQGVTAHLDPNQGAAHPTEDRYAATINAEIVAIASAIQQGKSLANATVYSSDEPTWGIFKIIVALGIKRLVYYGPKKNDRIQDYSKGLNIEVIVAG